MKQCPNIKISISTHIACRKTFVLDVNTNPHDYDTTSVVTKRFDRPLLYYWVLLHITLSLFNTNAEKRLQFRYRDAAKKRLVLQSHKKYLTFILALNYYVLLRALLYRLKIKHKETINRSEEFRLIFNPKMSRVRGEILWWHWYFVFPVYYTSIFWHLTDN